MAIALEPISLALGSAEICLGGWGRHAPSLASEIAHLGARSIELDIENNDATIALGPGANFWVSLTLPAGDTIRPLIQVVEQSGNRIRGRIRHLFPEQREQLVAYDRLRADSVSY